jgi:hypothetical protein
MGTEPAGTTWDRILVGIVVSLSTSAIIGLVAVLWRGGTIVTVVVCSLALALVVASLFVRHHDRQATEKAELESVASSLRERDERKRAEAAIQAVQRRQDDLEERERILAAWYTPRRAVVFQFKEATIRIPGEHDTATIDVVFIARNVSPRPVVVEAAVLRDSHACNVALTRSSSGIETDTITIRNRVELPPEVAEARLIELSGRITDRARDLCLTYARSDTTRRMSEINFGHLLVDLLVDKETKSGVGVDILDRGYVTLSDESPPAPTPARP